MSAHDPLLAWRGEFPILAHTTYLVSHSLGAMPRAAAAELQRYAETWASRGVRAWEEGWWEMPVRVGDLLAGLLGAPPGSVVMQPNVSIAEAVVLSCFDLAGGRRKIVYAEPDFPSVIYVQEAHARLGARPVAVPAEADLSVPLERLLGAIDEETLLVPVSHVLFRTAAVQDVAAIVRRAHEVGALVVADLYQSAGALPIDLTAWEVDFAVGGSVKWLCGGPGAGYLYVAPRLAPALQPRLTGWMAHRQPFAFASGPIAYAEDSRRFLSGTPNVSALYAARAGYEIVARVGVAAIREKSLRQVGRLRELAEAAGFRARGPSAASERGGMLVLEVAEGEAVVRELGRRNILVDHRPGAGLRISPHFYTADEELAQVIDALREIVPAHHRAR